MLMMDMNVEERAPQEVAVSKILQLTGSALINSILNLPKPEAFVQNLHVDDFYRLIKRIGSDDCLPILKFGSTEQWQHLLDLEIWKNDRMDSKKTLFWIQRLVKANASRFNEWVFEELHPLISLTLLKTTEIIYREEDDKYFDIPFGYLTLDESFYFKTSDDNLAQPVSDLLFSLMQYPDFEYQKLLYHLPSVNQAEAEEELYLWRNKRIAEYGFLPYEEAIAIYSPLERADLPSHKTIELPGILSSAEKHYLVPVASWNEISDFPLLAEGFSGISDNLQADRIRLEFAVLCNTLIAADSFAITEDDDQIVLISRKAAGYLNIAMETICSDKSISPTDVLLKNNLSVLFRVGYGAVMKLQWKVKRWLEESWFARQGKSISFWGSKYSEVIEALLMPRPCYFDPVSNNRRHFENIAELKKTQKILDYVEAFDKMLAVLSRLPQKDGVFNPEHYNTFYPILFNRWAHDLLNQSPSFAPLTREEAKKFFKLLREGEDSPPYTMQKYHDSFIESFMKSSVNLDPSSQKTLLDALNDLWADFRSEYENVPLSNLSARYSIFLKIQPRSISKSAGKSSRTGKSKTKMSKTV